jgi:hypothetical protein
VAEEVKRKALLGIVFSLEVRRLFDCGVLEPVGWFAVIGASMECRRRD